MAAISSRLAGSGFAALRSSQTVLGSPLRCLTTTLYSLSSTLTTAHQGSHSKPSSNGRANTAIHVPGNRLHYSTTTITKPSTTTELIRDTHFLQLILKLFGGEYGGYCVDERNFMLNLTPRDRERLGVEAMPWWFAAANHRAQLEVLATLLGLKPCMMYHTAGTDPAPVYDRLVTTALQPRFEEFRLDQYGFVLRKITHDIKIESQDDWRNTWVLADTRSPQWDLVKRIFFTPSNEYHKSSATARALGYPVLEHLGGPLTTRYVYVDVVATRNLARVTGGQMSQVMGFDYWASDHPEQYEHSLQHFGMYQRRLAKFGVELELVIVSDSKAHHVKLYDSSRGVLKRL
jgi:hypothetical protein